MMLGKTAENDKLTITPNCRNCFDAKEKMSKISSLIFIAKFIEKT